mmetsp:Transcript_68608/g.135720  ORF Transcript_68608/g.135720 Transcript_68608/m.135720 type:complete len:350 (-) Transcript_68608:185-1234(-)
MALLRGRQHSPLVNWVLLATVCSLSLRLLSSAFAAPVFQVGRLNNHHGHFTVSDAKVKSLSLNWRSSAGHASAALILAGTAVTALFSTAFRSPKPGCRRAAEPRTRRHGWGDDVVFHQAQVKSNVEAADGLRLISIEAPPVVATPFAKAGQFVQAKPSADAKPSFYAISSPPGSEGPLEFLIKEAENNAWLTGTKNGDTVQLSPAMGRGFDLACESWTSADVNQVGLFATGSGVAPIRAAIESGALAGKVCRLYFGARTQECLAYADRFDDWKQRGVEVVPVISKGSDNWTGRRGYVQQVLKEDEERGEGFVLPSRHGALLCGQKEMVQAVRSVYAELGVPEDRTLLNF